MASYRLTESAREDLRRIYGYGVREFGEAQADKYYDSLFERFEHLAQNPQMYPSVDHIRPGYKRSVCGVDSIFTVWSMAWWKLSAS